MNPRPTATTFPRFAEKVYPWNARARDEWVLSKRSARERPELTRPQAVFAESERGPDGRVAAVLTVLLTSRECPWRCVMCDLWKATTPEPVPPGMIPRQLDEALAAALRAGRAKVLKLYNSGSFFDPRAVPPADYPAIAARVTGFERVVVECHPNLVGRRVAEFRDQLRAAAEVASRPAPRLEVAMGLETAHPDVLEKLNKRLTLEQFRRAAEFLHRYDVDLRAFILVQPPFLPPAEAVEWAVRSVDFAFDCGASVAVLIPTRFGNGALEALAAAGLFTPPRLATLEAALDLSLRPARGRVFADLWNLEEFSDCPTCFPARRARLEHINLEQTRCAPVGCSRCGAGKKRGKKAKKSRVGDLPARQAQRPTVPGRRPVRSGRTGKELDAKQRLQ